MIKKTGMTMGAAGLLALAGGAGSADAALQELQIKGKIGLDAYTLSFGSASGTSGTFKGVDGTDSLLEMDVDLDFKLDLSQAVEARIDFELDKAKAGDGSPFAGFNNRYEFGLDQAYFSMKDFLFLRFTLKLGKQDNNFSLRANDSYDWMYGDDIAIAGVYSTQRVDLSMYFMKQDDDSDLKGSGTNEADADVFGVLAEYWLDDNNLIVATVNSKKDNAYAASTSMDMLMYLVGIDYLIGEKIEVYGQLGGESIDMKNPAGETSGSAMLINAGVEYRFTDLDWKPAINLDYRLESGASSSNGAADKWQSVTGTYKNSTRDAIYLEKGLAAWSGTLTAGGYSVIRLVGEMAPSKDTTVVLGLHSFTAEDDGLAKEDMGLEVDLLGTWKYSADVKFNAGAFVLSGAEYNGTTAPADGFETVMGFTMGSTLKF